jgi:hypothetical protein
MSYRIKEIQKGKAFKIYFINVSLSAGRFHGFLKLMTNYDDKPEIKIFLSGNFKNTEDNEKEQ